MAARSIGSTTICFGLVSIPVKLFTATSSENVSFNTLHKECNTRVKQQLFCPTHNQVVERDDTVKGYEIARGQFVVFGNEELRALETERSNTIEITEFVPASSVDFIQIEKTQYLGPDKGGHKAYNLLAHAMKHIGVVAIGRYNARGKGYVVMLRPYDKGLALHQLFYADEVRSFGDVDIGDDVRFSDAEQDLAEKLIAQLRQDRFDPSRYRDDYSDRVRRAAEEKAAGLAVTHAPEQPKAQIIDLFDALKRSLDAMPDKPRAAKPNRPIEAVADEPSEASADKPGKRAVKGPAKAMPKEPVATKRKKKASEAG